MQSEWIWIDSVGVHGDELAQHRHLVALQIPVVPRSSGDEHSGLGVRWVVPVVVDETAQVSQLLLDVRQQSVGLR